MKKKVIIIGGGLSGLTSAIVLSRYRKFDVEVWDRSTKFINQLLLHRTVHQHLNNYTQNFYNLSKQFNFSFRNIELLFDIHDIQQWHNTGKVTLSPNLKIPFDYLIVSTGAEFANLELGKTMDWNSVFTIRRIKTNSIDQYIQSQVLSGKVKEIAVVGGGSTGIQFLFELSDYLNAKNKKIRLRLIDYSDTLFSNYSKSISDYVIQKIYREKIYYYPSMTYQGSANGKIFLKNNRTTTEYSLPADITFLFIGNKPTPTLLKTNHYGMVYTESMKVCKNIYASGDCSFFEGEGLNSLTAQSALRKSKLVAQNIVSHSLNRNLSEYDYKEIGYFISLGFSDAVGWLLNPDVIVTGKPAYILKESIDKRFELLISGIDTF
jgi:NADH:ubiquinone reductase (H+-translocating)